MACVRWAEGGNRHSGCVARRGGTRGPTRGPTDALVVGLWRIDRQTPAHLAHIWRSRVSSAAVVRACEWNAEEQMLYTVLATREQFQSVLHLQSMYRVHRAHRESSHMQKTLDGSVFSHHTSVPTTDWKSLVIPAVSQTPNKKSKSSAGIFNWRAPSPLPNSPTPWMMRPCKPRLAIDKWECVSKSSLVHFAH